MKKIGPKIAHWVENQSELATLMGLATPSLNQMLSGRTRLPLLRFLQIVHYLKRDVAEANEIFNLFLAKVDLPPDSLRIVKKAETDAITDTVRDANDTAKTVKKAEADAIIDAVMAADIDDAAKVKVYNIIKSIRGK